MNLITGRAGAAHITPRQDAMWHQGLIEMESCILDAYENFAAEIITNNEVRIRSGVGMLQGRFFCIEPNTYDSAEIANGNQGEERIDLIVARIAVDASANTQSASIEVIQGTPAAENPTTPEAITGDLDAGDLIADYPLAEVHISGINITSVENTFNAGWLSLPQTRQNINFIGLNPISSPEEDTIENWSALGTGVAYINSNRLLIDQPTTNGFIVNKVYNKAIHQTFYMRGGGQTWVRSGTSSGWNTSWVELYSASSDLVSVKDNLGIGKSLWSGSWASGSIEVPNTADYQLFQITLDGQGTSILAMKTGSYIRGIGGHPISNGLSSQGFAATFSGNTWTFGRTNQMSHSSGADHGTQSSNAVERIRGII